jgi:O-antigen/teichoic acid export membrane protein
MTSAGVLALDVLGQPSDAVGGYAAAASIVGLMTVLVTSTNRIYARDLALEIHVGTPESLQAILRRRLTWMLPVTGLALTTLWLFSTELLALFGPEFATHGVWPLRILACGAAVSMLFALTPTLLKYTERYSAVLRAVGLGAGLQVLLLVLLVPRYGPVGAALAATAGIAVKHLWLMTAFRAERRAAGP